MKFRGLITDSVAMKDFLNVSNSLTKLSKDCVMRITKSKVYFIISEEDIGPKRPLVWCELPVNFYFKEFNLVGVSEVHDEIYLELSTALLARSLATIKSNVSSLKIKLTNKQIPCLTLEVEQMPGEGVISRQCVHDIPVEVINVKHWNDYREPHYDNFHVSILMPHLKPLKNIVERMKTMSHGLTVSADRNGRLTLQIKTNMVKLSAHFPNLNVESFAVGHLTTLSGEENEDTVSATVDIKKFLMFISGMQVNNCKTSCSIVHGSMVKLFLEQPGSLTFQCFLTEIDI